MKIQLKSTSDTEIKVIDTEVYYDRPIKFLNFCDVCDIPVTLMYYDEKKRGLIGYGYRSIISIH